MAPFGCVSGLFRVRFGSVSGPFGGVGVGSGRGAFVREKNITKVGMTGDAFSIKAPKESSKKSAATLEGKSLTRGNVLRILFLFLEDFGGASIEKVSPLNLLRILCLILRPELDRQTSRRNDGLRLGNHCS